ncbi:MAG: amidohydrolase family protein [Planctomycetes bacterium]|nr:amidohydrolase family protein [Planctomycetota bacterium]
MATSDRCVGALTALLLVLGLGASMAFASDSSSPAAVAADEGSEESAKKPPEDNGEEQKKDEPKEHEDHYLAIVGGLVHPSGGEILEGVTILCKNDRIVAMGPHVTIPEDAETIDATGYHVYPGLIGIDTRRLVGGRSSTDVFSMNVTLALAAGLTTVVNGSSVLKLTFGTLEGHELKTGTFEGIDYSTRDPGRRKRFRDSLERIVQYRREVEAYEEEKRTNPEAKKPDDKWIRGDYAKAKRLMDREVPGLATVQTSEDIIALTGLAKQYGFELILRGAREGYIVAGDIARSGAACIVSPRDRADRDPERMRPNGASPENARILYEHGVPIVITPQQSGISLMGVAGRDLAHLPMEAAFAVRGGLPEEAAIDAITIEPARLLRVDHRVGSIAVGKDADFAITDGDLLHYMTLVRWTVVNGEIAYDKAKDSLYDHIRPNGDRDAPPPDDHWPRRLGEDW